MSSSLLGEVTTESLTGSAATSSSARQHSSSPPTTSVMKRRGPWTRKPLSLALEQDGSDSPHTPRRHLSLVDLVSIGVGGTIGSGIFVLTGYIAHHYAGPSTAISFVVSGVAAGCSGLCYAELAGRIPAAGSTYIYAYVCLGELAAVIAAACLTLEYGVSGAAVARSWGDKIVEWLTYQWGWERAGDYLGGEFWNPMAGLVSALSTLLLVYGVQESKQVTNFFTALKVGLVVFMIIGGFLLMDTENLAPFVPYGASGVLRGATSSFFGYLGYDEVCCLAAEANNPSRDMPRAVIWTLGIVTILYVAASFALAGMVPLAELSDTSAFPAAFHSRGVEWASQLTAAGEVITLPVVVLISLMAQPRLFAALAKDHLLPKVFAGTDAKGNLVWGSILSGIPMTLLATFVPFSYLDDLISVGILMAFSMTNSSLILLRCNSPPDQPNRLSWSLVLFNFVAFMTGLACRADSPLGLSLQSIVVGTLLLLAITISMTFPKSKDFGGDILRRHDSNAEGLLQLDNGNAFSFQAPLVPLFPLTGISINWYLISQLELNGIAFLVVYIGMVSSLYLASCRGTRGWRGVNGRPSEEADGIVLQEMR